MGAGEDAEIVQVPGAGPATIDSGVYGAENFKGIPIMKRFKLMSNSQPHLEALVPRLTPKQKQYCQPVCGGETSWYGAHSLGQAGQAEATASFC